MKEINSKLKNSSKNTLKKKWLDIYANTMVHARLINKNEQVFSGKQFLNNIMELISQFQFHNLVEKEICLVWQNDLDWFLVMIALIETNNCITVISSEDTKEDIATKVKQCSNAILMSHEKLNIPNIDDRLQVNIKLVGNSPEVIFLEKTEVNHEIDTVVPGMCIFSSGTSGEPKKIHLTKKTVYDVTKIYIKELSNENLDNILLLLPLSAIYSITIGLAVIFSGKKLILAEPANKNLKHIIAKNKIEVIPAVPILIENIEQSILSKIMTKSRIERGLIKACMYICWYFRRYLNLNIGKKLFAQIHKQVGPNLRLFISGGASLSITTLKNMHSLGFTIYEGYGITECGGVISMRKNEFSSFGSVGYILPDVQIRFSSNSDQKEGEVQIKSARLSLNNKTDPWFKTGDIGYLNKDGNLYITGRQKDIVVLSNEEKFHPEIVEKYYLHVEGVKALAIVGIQNETVNGDEIVLFIIPNDKYSSDEIIRQIRNIRIPNKFCAHSCIFMDDLPRNALGKIKRFELKQFYQQNKNDKISL